MSMQVIQQKCLKLLPELAFDLALDLLVCFFAITPESFTPKPRVCCNWRLWDHEQSRAHPPRL